MQLLLAFRNVFRHRGRFLLGTFIIGVASLLLVYASGQISGVKQALERGMTDSLTGHIQIKPQASPIDFFDVSTGRRLELIEADELAPVLAKIRALPEVEAASPRLRFGALVGNGESSTPAVIIAVDQAEDAKVIPDMAEVLPLLNSGTQASLVSEHLVEKSGVPLGDELLVLTETPSEVFNGRPYDVTGYASSPVLIDEFLSSVIFVNLDRTRNMLYVDDVATDIAVRVKPAYVDDLDGVIARIEAALTPAERDHLAVYSYRQIARAVGSVGNIATGMAAIQIGAVIFVMLVIVLILTKMGLHERRREIGTLISLGMTRMGLVSMFVYEVIIKVLIGYGAGFLIALLLLLGIQASGGMRASTLVEQYMNGGKIMMPVLDAENILLGLAAIIVTALLTTITTCWQAGSQNAVTLLNAKE